jgi:hypothetical protein
VAADTLTVKIGYAGMDFETIKTYTATELVALGLHEHTYTWITRVKMPVFQLARGIYLSDIIKSAGVDIDSIARIHFTCTDSYETKELTIGYLFNTKKYYYPNLIDTWDYDLQQAGTDAESGAIEVMPMLATEEYWQKTITGAFIPATWDNVTSENRFRLVFGMSDVETPTAMNSARWVHSIEIVLAGTPPKEEKPPKSKDKIVGSNKGDKPSSNTDSVKDKEKPAHVVPPVQPEVSEPTKPNSPVQQTAPTQKFTLLKVGQSGNSQDGYQPWRINGPAEGVEAYIPPEKDKRMAKITATTMIGLLILGGLLRIASLRGAKRRGNLDCGSSPQ